LRILFFKNKIPITPQEKKERNSQRLLLIVSGIMLGISFPPFPFPCQLFMFVALVPYFYVIEKKKTLAEINRATYLASFVFCLITIYWVGSWQKGTDPYLMIAGGTLLFFNPLLFLIPSTLYYMARRSISFNFALIVFPLFWVTYEYLYMLTDISFPWLTLGSGLSHFIAFIQIADMIGAVGLSVIVIYINILFYKAFIKFRISDKSYVYYFAGALIIFSAVLLYGYYRLSTFKVSKTEVRVGLVQPNIDPWSKWQSNNLDESLHEYLTLSRDAINKGANFVLWPETALPVYLTTTRYIPEKDSIYNFIRSTSTYLLTGMPDIQFYNSLQKIPSDAKYSREGDFYYSIYNGVLLFSPYTMDIQRYGKMKLVPFGEKVPFSDQIPFLANFFKWGVGISGWNVGRDTTIFKFNILAKKDSSLEKYDLKVNSLVCYESVYPYFVADFVKKGADLITVVTNDSWYGKSSGPYQHKEIAVLRAIENRKSVIRDANGGISCIIDPLGRTLMQSKLFTKTVLVGDVPIQEGETFFTKYPMIVPYAASYFSLIIVIFFVVTKIRKRLK
jgi:apolipoprotein N-acyltransferase